MSDQEWLEVQRDYLKRQAPLRAAWLNERRPQAERDAAHAALLELVAETTAKCPPITGTFYYTEEEEQEAEAQLNKIAPYGKFVRR